MRILPAKIIWLPVSTTSADQAVCLSYLPVSRARRRHRPAPAMSVRSPREWLVVALLALLTAPGAALACSCTWGGPFTTVALGTDLIVLADVRSYSRHSMDVTIVEVLKGTETRRVIRVWGDDGALCRPYVSAFPRGTRWILALKRRGEPAARDYVISICGDFWLEVRGDQAVGRIIAPQHGRSLETVPLAEMLAWIRSGGARRIAPLQLPL